MRIVEPPMGHLPMRTRVMRIAKNAGLFSQHFLFHIIIHEVI